MKSVNAISQLYLFIFFVFLNSLFQSLTLLAEPKNTLNIFFGKKEAIDISSTQVAQDAASFIAHERPPNSTKKSISDHFFGSTQPVTPIEFNRKKYIPFHYDPATKSLIVAPIKESHTNPVYLLRRYGCHNFHVVNNWNTYIKQLLLIPVSNPTPPSEGSSSEQKKANKTPEYPFVESTNEPLNAKIKEEYNTIINSYNRILKSDGLITAPQASPLEKIYILTSLPDMAPKISLADSSRPLHYRNFTQSIPQFQASTATQETPTEITKFRGRDSFHPWNRSVTLFPIDFLSNPADSTEDLNAEMTEKTLKIASAFYRKQFKKITEEQANDPTKSVVKISGYIQYPPSNDSSQLKKLKVVVIFKRRGNDWPDPAKANFEPPQFITCYPEEENPPEIGSPIPKFETTAGQPQQDASQRPDRARATNQQHGNSAIQPNQALPAGNKNTPVPHAIPRAIILKRANDKRNNEQDETSRNVRPRPNE